MPINLALKKIIDAKLANSAIPQWHRPIDQVRKAFKDLWGPEITGQVLEVEEIVNILIESESKRIPIRIYIPGNEKQYPVMMYFHGGGYVKGDLDSCDAFCRRFSKTTNFVIVSVGYRLAPENNFPVALEDVYEATLWASKNLDQFRCDTSRLAVSGESAGGNLAAVVSRLARDDKAPSLMAQVLLQPVVDFTLSYPSISMSEQECLVPKQDLEWYYQTYLGGDGDPRSTLVSPILADNFSHLPPAIIVTAEYDTLRDEAGAYANKLREAGNSVSYKCYRGMIHGFMQMGGLVEEAQESIDYIDQEMRRITA